MVYIEFKKDSVKFPGQYAEFHDKEHFSFYVGIVIPNRVMHIKFLDILKLKFTGTSGGYPLQLMNHTNMFFPGKHCHQSGYINACIVLKIIDDKFLAILELLSHFDILSFICSSYKKVQDK